MRTNRAFVDDSFSLTLESHSQCPCPSASQTSGIVLLTVTGPQPFPSFAPGHGFHADGEGGRVVLDNLKQAADGDPYRVVLDVGGGALEKVEDLKG